MKTLTATTAFLVVLAPACIVTKTEIPDLEAAEKSSQAQFELLTQLAGRWTGTAKTGTESFPVESSWRVTAGGSAVEETLLAGTPHEMVTLYHRDGPYLMLTHYCSAGNQPRMRAQYVSPPPSSAHSSRIDFGYLDATNMASPSDLHMGAVQLELEDADHMRAKWTAYVGGKFDHAAEFTLTRQR